MFEFLISKKKNKTDDKIFHELFQESAKTCKAAATLFLDILKNGTSEEQIVSARQYKHKSSKILKKTLKAINQTKNNGLEKEDIQNIASLLNKITKKIIKAILNYRVYRISQSTEQMILQSKNLITAMEELENILIHFANNPTLQEITDRNLKMKEIETRGDEILYLALDILFSGQYDALNVIKLRDIYKDIENALDTCMNVTDVITNIFYKEFEK